MGEKAGKRREKRKEGGGGLRREAYGVREKKGEGSQVVVVV